MPTAAVRLTPLARLVALTRRFVIVTVAAPDGICTPVKVIADPVTIPATEPEEVMARASVAPVVVFRTLLAKAGVGARATCRFAAPPDPVQVNCRSASCSLVPVFLV